MRVSGSIQTDCAVKEVSVVQKPQGFIFLIQETHPQLLSHAQNVDQSARKAMARYQF